MRRRGRQRLGLVRPGRGLAGLLGWLAEGDGGGQVDRPGGVDGAVPGARGACPAGVVPPVSAWLTWAAVRCGNLDRMRAATPATMPLDVLVELIRA